MAFLYDVTSAKQTGYTPGAKGVMCKSYKIDFANGSGDTATSYTLGTLLKGSQIVGANVVVATAVSGSSVTAATIAVAANGRNIISGGNVFATGVSNMGSAVYYTNFAEVVGNDVPVTYTLTLTGGTAVTAGVLYVNLLYVS